MQRVQVKFTILGLAHGLVQTGTGIGQAITTAKTLGDLSVSAGVSGVGAAANPNLTWFDKLKVSATTPEAVGKMAGGLVQGAGSAMGSIGAAGTAADAMASQSEAQSATQEQAAEDAYRLQQLRGRQSLEEIGARGVEERESIGEQIEGRLTEARLPYEEKEKDLARRESNLGMLRMG